MRYFTFISLVILSAVFADQPGELGFRRTGDPSGGGSSDALIYNQTYDFGLLQNGYSNYGAGDRWVCDDFIISYSTDLWQVHIWMIWTGEPGSIMNFIISEDDAGDSDPNTNTDYWAEAVPCTNTFTGDSNWGYDIYETFCELTVKELPWLIGGVHYYIEIQADVVDNCFILISPNMVGDYCWYNDGSGTWQRSDVVFGEDSDMFFELWDPLALESETWGSIKTLF